MSSTWRPSPLCLTGMGTDALEQRIAGLHLRCARLMFGRMRSLLFNYLLQRLKCSLFDQNIFCLQLTREGTTAQDHKLRPRAGAEEGIRLMCSPGRDRCALGRA